MIRYFTSGESHGPGLTGIVEGVPAGLELTEDYIEQHLIRRQKGYGRGGRMAFEKDHADIQSGVRFSKTTGAPIAMAMVNRAYEKDDSNWPKVMAKDGERGDVEKITLPRPGHADLVGLQKYRFDDIRPVIERSSARETAMRVACCSIARKFLKEFGIEIGGHVIQLGSIGYDGWDTIRKTADPLAEKGAESIFKAADESEVRCLDAELSQQMREEIKIKEAKAQKVASALRLHSNLSMLCAPSWALLPCPHALPRKPRRSSSPSARVHPLRRCLLQWHLHPRLARRDFPHHSLPGVAAHSAGTAPARRLVTSSRCRACAWSYRSRPRRRTCIAQGCGV